MFHPNPQLTVNTQPLSVQDPSAMLQLSQNGSSTPVAEVSRVEAVVYSSKKLQDNLKVLGLKIKQHEDNLTFLKTNKNSIEEAIVDLQVSLAKYQSSKPEMEDQSGVQSEDEIVQNILKIENSAAAVICQLKIRHGAQASHLPWMIDVLGVVATLGKINDEKLNRVLSEYLGTENMLAIVCKSYNAVKSMECYENDGSIDKNSGLHGLGSSIGRPIDGRFLVICLENLRPYYGTFIADDPQRRLDIFKPKLPNGELPPGFMGYAVNMIQVDHVNLFCVSINGDGLRETLFYHLFSRLQVYKTRTEMLQALPLISDGAVSLDGGIIRGAGVISHGSREEVGIRFPKGGGSVPHEKYLETEDELKEMKWKKERLLDDIQREQTLLDQTKIGFNAKKQEFVKFLAQSSPFTAQVQPGRDRQTPTPR